VIINRRVAEAVKVILTGKIGYHYLAGFGEGRKTIMPGSASFESCVAAHLLAPLAEGRRHPFARTGVFQDNPLHEDTMEAALLVSPKFLFNTILSPDYAILNLRVGHREETFTKGIILLISILRLTLLSLRIWWLLVVVGILRILISSKPAKPLIMLSML
jgi:nickel-dependent lactate racemase